MNKQRRIEQIDKQIIKLGIIDAPASVMLGLGLYATFTEGELFLDILNNELLVTGLLGVGGGIMFLVLIKLASLSLEKSKLKKAND